MTAAVRISVIQPRLMDATRAAEYCNLPARRFRELCGVQPVELPHGKQAWDIRDLDAWIEGLKGNVADGDEAILGRL